jgi:hypothetical protein
MGDKEQTRMGKSLSMKNILCLAHGDDQILRCLLILTSSTPYRDNTVTAITREKKKGKTI